jgi:hypothetical protein
MSTCLDLSKSPPEKELRNEIIRLRNAIRKHRDAKGHNLCWENNLELYALLPETIEVDPEVPPFAEFLRNCIAYRESLEKENK